MRVLAAGKKYGWPAVLIPGEKVIMAHSLGNMVVSSMIQDYGLQVNCYLMCNSAGDHVLELYRNNDIGLTDGFENLNQMFERYSWHKQEIWKGRKTAIAFMGTTDWSGWGFRKNALGFNAVSATNAWLMSSGDLQTNTVFKLQPASMNTNSIPLLVRAAHLAQGITARTPASGAVPWGEENSDAQMINLQSIDEMNGGISRPNGWIVRPNGLFGDWGNRWMHSDIKDVPYYYVYRFFEKVKELGGL